jgi:hypothetical protein
MCSSKHVEVVLKVVSNENYSGSKTVSIVVGYCYGLWRWDVLCCITEPSLYNLHKSISGQYCLTKAGVVVQICEALQMVCSAWPFYTPPPPLFL